MLKCLDWQYAKSSWVYKLGRIWLFKNSDLQSAQVTKDKCIIYSISDFAARFHFHIEIRMPASSETAWRLSFPVCLLSHSVVPAAVRNGKLLLF